MEWYGIVTHKPQESHGFFMVCLGVKGTIYPDDLRDFRGPVMTGSSWIVLEVTALERIA